MTYFMDVSKNLTTDDTNKYNVLLYQTMCGTGSQSVYFRGYQSIDVAPLYTCVDVGYPACGIKMER